MKTEDIGAGDLFLSSPNGVPPLAYLEARGQARARETQALQPREEDLRSLRDLARTLAVYFGRPPFDPAGPPEDHVRHAMYARSDAALGQVSEEIRIAGHRCVESSDRAARKRAQVGSESVIPHVAMIAAVAVLAVSVAPTLHDFVFITLADDLLNWFASLVVAALIGTMLAWGVMVQAPTGSRAPVVVGIVISVGLAVLRLSAAETPREVVFAVGLMLMEIGVVLFLDWRAGVYAGALSAWRTRLHDAEEAEAVNAVQEREYQRLLAERTRLEASVAGHILHLERREELASNGTAREQAYVEAICDGYFHGIAMNRGALQRLAGGHHA